MAVLCMYEEVWQYYGCMRKYGIEAVGEMLMQ